MADTSSAFSSIFESTSSSSSSSSSSDRYTVFDSDYQYIPTSKSLLYDEDFRTKTYFQLGKAETTASSTTSSTSSSTTTTTSSSSSSTPTSTTTTNASTTFNTSDFWQLILTEYTENHSEKFTPYNTIAEAFVWTASGPNPVEVTLSGFLPMSGSWDYRTSFLYNYVAAFRARQLAAYEKTLTLVVKDTTMQLLLTSITLSESADSPDLIQVAMTGYGYKYKNINSAEPELYKAYYGTAAAVPTSASTSATDEKKEEAKTADSTTEDAQKNEALKDSSGESDVQVADLDKTSSTDSTAASTTSAEGAVANASNEQVAANAESTETKKDTVQAESVKNSYTLPPGFAEQTST